MQNACYISFMTRFRTAVLVALVMSVFTATLPAQNDDSTHVGHLMADSVRNALHAVVADDGRATVVCAWSERFADGTRLRASVLSRLQRDHIQAVTVYAGEGREVVRPTAAWLNDGRIMLFWQEGDGETQRVRGRVLDAAALRVGDTLGWEAPFDVNDGTGQALMPSAGRSVDGEIVVAWQDYRNGDVDIYAQRYASDGTAVGANVMVNDDSSRAMQGPPRAAADNGASVVFIWSDNRGDGTWKFYTAPVRRGSVEKNRCVDDTWRKAMTTLPAAVGLSADSMMFAWKDYREGHSNIYFRRADLGTGGFSPAVRVNDDSTDRWQRLVVLDSDGGGHVIACWEDYRQTENNQQGDMYLQAYAPDGSPQGENVRVNLRDDRIPRKMPRIAMFPDGVFLVVWHQGDEGRYNLHARWLRWPGSGSGDSFCISCSP